MLIEQITASGTQWYFHDALATRGMLGGDGDVAGTFAYDPDGKVIESRGATTPIQYAGGYTDAEIGFSYLWARYHGRNERRTSRSPKAGWSHDQPQ